MQIQNSISIDHESIIITMRNIVVDDHRECQFSSQDMFRRGEEIATSHRFTLGFKETTVYRKVTLAQLKVTLAQLL